MRPNLKGLFAAVIGKLDTLTTLGRGTKPPPSAPSIRDLIDFGHTQPLFDDCTITITSEIQAQVSKDVNALLMAQDETGQQTQIQRLINNMKSPYIQHNAKSAFLVLTRLAVSPSNHLNPELSNAMRQSVMNGIALFAQKNFSIHDDNTIWGNEGPLRPSAFQSAIQNFCLRFMIDLLNHDAYQNGAPIDQELRGMAEEHLTSISRIDEKFRSHVVSRAYADIRNALERYKNAAIISSPAPPDPAGP